MRASLWVNKKVLITGSGGFVGRHLLRFFAENGAVVLGISRHPLDPKREKRVDVTDKRSVFESIRTFFPHVVFHLASEAVVEAGQAHPYETFSNNIVSTLNVLEACRIQSVPRIVIASTAHVYGDAPMPFREDKPARPSRPYETSKTCADLIAQSYADSFNLPVVIPRFANIYGPGDTNTTRIIPKTIKSILTGKEPTLWDGQARRDYLYVDDAIRAYDVLGRVAVHTLERNRIYNFATGKSVTARQLIEMVITLMAKDVTIKKIPSPRTHELTRQNVAWTKAKRILGWEPLTDLSTGLKKTIDWFSKNYDSLN